METYDTVNRATGPRHQPLIEFDFALAGCTDVQSSSECEAGSVRDGLECVISIRVIRRGRQDFGYGGSDR